MPIPTPSPPPVALFLHSPQMGGAQRRTIAIANGFAACGLPVTLVFVRAEGPLRPEIDAAVRIVDLGVAATGGRGRQVLAAVPKLARWLEAHRPGLLVSAANHVNLATLAAHGLMRGPRPPLVLRATNHFTRSQGPVAGRPRRRWAERLLYPRAGAIAAVSDEVRADLEGLLQPPPGKVVTIFEPVSGPDIVARAAEPLDHPWFGADRPPVVLGVGRLAPQKDFPTLVAAFARIADRTPARLLILGDGPDRPALQAQIAALGLPADRVALPGLVTNPFPYMAQGAAFVLSSAWEGLPGVLIEALACGCPSVSTDCPGGSRSILRDGALGPLVPVGDAAAMGEAILDVLARPVPRELLTARAADFSVAASVAQYLALFARLGYPVPAVSA